MLLGALCAQPFYVVSMHVVNYRYNEPNVPNSASKVRRMSSMRAIHYIGNRYGLRGFFRGLLPTTIFSIFALWDQLIPQLFEDYYDK